MAGYESHLQGQLSAGQKIRKKAQRKKTIQTAVAKVNTTGNVRSGKSYFVQPGKGGSWHVYDNGKRVFVKSKPTFRGL